MAGENGDQAGGVERKGADPARSRRLFFLSLPSEIAALWRDVRGVPQRTLAELPGLPDDVLGRIRPALAADSAFTHEQGRLVRRDRATAAVLGTWEMGEREYALVSRFSGSQTLAQIASWASAQQGLARGEAFKIARAVFLRLVEGKACRPVNCPSSEGQRESLDAQAADAAPDEREAPSK